MSCTTLRSRPGSPAQTTISTCCWRGCHATSFDHSPDPAKTRPPPRRLGSPVGLARSDLGTLYVSTEAPGRVFDITSGGDYSSVPPFVVGLSFFSAALFVLLWNGRFRNLDGQGAIGALISAAILAAALGFNRRRPATR